MIGYIVQRYTSREQAPDLNICLKLRSLILNREKIFIRAYFPGTNLTLIWQRDFLRESTVVNGVQNLPLANRRSGLVPGKRLERKDMADSPETARWYIAELVEELILDGNIRNVIHRKTRVIFADCQEDAYEKALSLSQEHEPTYLNQTLDGAQTRYWGLTELNLLQPEAEVPPQLKKRPVLPHFRQSDQLSPAQVAMLMSIQPQALPN